MKKNKISIIGAGNAGCISALKLLELRETNNSSIGEIEIYYDPNIPIERVGQGNTIPVHELIFDTLGINWVTNNPIKATIKQGIRYKNWGKNNHNFFHPFWSGEVSCHYVPNLLSKEFLKSGYFKVIEKNITDPESEIDSDYIIDCRGRSSDLNVEYKTLANPLNSVILSKKNERDLNLSYTDCVATPHGWTFIIPNHDSTSYGYLYNNTITSKDNAEEDFIQRFNVQPDGYFSFNNYVAKNIWQGERTILNGNKYTFVEPLEATSTTVYLQVVDYFDDYLNGEITKKKMNSKIKKNVKEYSNFILWHYINGSKFESPFWQYAQNLAENYFDNSEEFKSILEQCIDMTSIQLTDDHDIEYGMWPPPSIRNWYDNVVLIDKNQKK